MSLKAIDFKDEFSPLRNDNFKDHYVLVFDHFFTKTGCFRSMYLPKEAGKPLRHETSLTTYVERVTQLFLMRERMFPFAVNNLGLVGKKS